jgi:lipid II:glycine glycyltransferase (peptidoglycan interpeptide bridge formation enzyme)
VIVSSAPHGRRAAPSVGRRPDVRAITTAEHRAFLRTVGSASFLQTPGWGQVKSHWRAESIGFFAGEQLAGAALVLYRSLPLLRRSLAYLPEGPVLDWSDDGLPDVLDALARYVKRRGAFGIRMGPPVVVRRWDAATVKAAIADPAVAHLGDVPATSTDPGAARVRSVLETAGWRREVGTEGFAAGQPPYVFQVPLAGRSAADLLAGMNQQWRRNIKLSRKAGVLVERGIRADLAGFHALYLETAQRDGFRPRPMSYFERMWDALLADDADRIRLYLARHESDLVAATIGIRVGGHVWYSYGASSTSKREVRGSNAVQWQMMTDALEAGADVYDLRGITDTVDADDPHLGLIQFKVGTGGEAVEYLGEWDLPLNPLLYQAFTLYLRRR